MMYTFMEPPFEFIVQHLTKLGKSAILEMFVGIFGYRPYSAFGQMVSEEGLSTT